MFNIIVAFNDFMPNIIVNFNDPMFNIVDVPVFNIIVTFIIRY